MLAAGDVVVPRAWARWWFGLLAASGAFWWMLVPLSDEVREATLGTWPPELLVVPDLVLFVAPAAAAARTGEWRWAAANAAWSGVISVGLAAQALTSSTAVLGLFAMVLATVGSVAGTALLRSGRISTGWFFVGPFRFTPSPEARPRTHLRRSLTQLAVFWSVFFVAVPALAVRVEARLGLGVGMSSAGAAAAAVVGSVLFVVGSVLGGWSCVTMALQGAGTPLPAVTARRLVVAGPYRFVRNPMAVAGVVQTVGIALALGTWTLAVGAFIGAVFWDLVIRPEEEADLLRRFGVSYGEYRASVRRWVPGRR